MFPDVASETERAAAALEGLPVEPCNVADYERIARETLDPGAYGYFAGGADDERTLRENVEAFSPLAAAPARARRRERGRPPPRPCSAREVSMPLLVAPVAFQRMAHPDGEPGWPARPRRPGP